MISPAPTHQFSSTPGYNFHFAVPESAVEESTTTRKSRLATQKSSSTISDTTMTLTPIPEDQSCDYSIPSPPASPALWTTRHKRFRSAPACLRRKNSGDNVLELINQTRAMFGLKPFKRSRMLCTLALAHAQSMAGQQELRHSVDTIQQLRTKLGGYEHVGENVHKGTSVQEMHEQVLHEANLQHRINRQNILSSHFDEIGFATAKAQGKEYDEETGAPLIYLCIFFRQSS